MRLTFAAPLLLAALALSGCGGDLLTPNPGAIQDFPATCAQQSDWATQGRTDGGNIRITCP